MKTKIVYSIISSKSDVFLEETMVSIYSLRLYNPDAVVVLVVDDQTYDSFTCSRSQINEYVSEIIVIKVPSELSKKQKSRFLKTNLRQYIKGDYLFVDSDTIITSSLEEIDTFIFPIGAVKDRHLDLEVHTHKNDIYKCAKIIGWNIGNEVRNYYNSGVFYVKDIELTHDFYKHWHDIWLDGLKKGVDIDQPSLGKTNYLFNNIIHELDGVWNCQILTNGVPYLSNAKILHYFTSNVNNKSNYPFLLSDVSIYESIKKDGTLTTELKQRIFNAKSQFSNNYEIIGGARLTFLNTSTCAFIWWIYLKSSKVFNALEYIFSVFQNIYHKLKLVKR